MLKQLWRRYGLNPFDRILRKALRDNQERFLICWNRGLGDIALGLYALVYRIRQYIPNAQITFLTRADLKQGFDLLDQVTVLVDENMQRAKPFNLDVLLSEKGLSRSDFDIVLERPDPTGWLMWQLGRLVPRMRWQQEWDDLAKRFAIDPEKPCMGVHVQTETVYNYEKNWPVEHWKLLFEKVVIEQGTQVLLFGFSPNPSFEREGVIDLRGKTTLAEMLSLIKNRCQYLVVPDSGVLSLTYYLNCAFPLRVVSLWADPRQGVLKQNVASPNPHLVHLPLLAPQEDLRQISVAQVMKALYGEAAVCSIH